MTEDQERLAAHQKIDQEKADQFRQIKHGYFDFFAYGLTAVLAASLFFLSPMIESEKVRGLVQVVFLTAFFVLAFFVPMCVDKMARKELDQHTQRGDDMSNEQTKDQEKLKREKLIKEAMRQASEDQRKVLDQAQDSKKIYWKG